MEDAGFVYRWTNNINNKWYIGSHKGSLDDGYLGGGLLFKKAIKKYGIDSFTRDILYIGKDYRKEEDRILKELNVCKDKNSYNLKDEALGGTFFGFDNGMYGKKHSEESKKMIGKNGIMRVSEKHRLAHSKLMTGPGNPMYGKKHSDFSKQKYKTTVEARREKWGFLKSNKHHKTAINKVYNTLRKHGKEVSPRGQKTIEIENFGFSLPPYVRFCNFEIRKLNINYIKTEFLWYLNGDKFDTTISESASLWKSFINKDGVINSNYGQYIFGELNQFDYVVNELKKDKDSRRAAITILQPYHTLDVDVVDVPCTYGLSFRIRNNKLNMTVKMRSQDSYFGFASDIPTFSFIHEMVLVMLKDEYPELEYGEYYHFVESFHIYERHFKFLEKLQTKNNYSLVLCPKISSSEEIQFLRKLDFTNIPDNYEFTKWLIAKEEK